MFLPFSSEADANPARTDLEDPNDIIALTFISFPIPPDILSHTLVIQKKKNLNVNWLAK